MIDSIPKCQCDHICGPNGECRDPGRELSTPYGYRYFVVDDGNRILGMFNDQSQAIKLHNNRDGSQLLDKDHQPELVSMLLRLYSLL